MSEKTYTITLSLDFDTSDYDLSPEELVTMFKHDFMDTILKQWTYKETFENLEVEVA